MRGLAGFVRTHMIKGRKALYAFLFSDNYKKISFWIRENVLPVLYPRRCPGCGRLLSFGNLICRDCRAWLPWIREPCCFLCGKPVYSEEQELCYDCRRFKKSFLAGISLLLYNEETRPIIADFKYHNRRSLSRYFAEEICARYASRLASWNPGMIVPVPIHKRRRKIRGYNQAGLVARDLSALTGIPYLPDLLVRSSDTTPLKKLTPQARLDHLKNAFEFNPDYKNAGLQGKSVLLIDDIYTTGATLEICTRTLMDAGFGPVYICTLCTGVARD
jgi:ComF family protein